MNKQEKAMKRLQELLQLQQEIESKFGSDGYNVFVFGSYPTIQYVEGKSDIDIAIYSPDFGLYTRISLFLEEYFQKKQIKSDIFYIDTLMEAPVYCAPLQSKIQFTDYYPQDLTDFYNQCKIKLEENKTRINK